MVSPLQLTLGLIKTLTPRKYKRNFKVFASLLTRQNIICYMKEMADFNVPGVLTTV